MNKQGLTIWAILLLLAVSAAQLGCAGDNANAADATPASETKDEDKSEDKSEDGNGEGDEKKKKKKKKEEAVPVEVAQIERGSIESVLRFSSNLETESQVQVFSQARRLITELLVEEGDRVEKDQVLLRLQDDEQRSALAKATSQLERAQREYERKKRLHAQELISEQEFNDATYELDQLGIARQDAQRELSYTDVRAPIAGTVTSRLVNLGDQVQIGQHLYDVVDFESIVARIYVPEKHLLELRKGLEARISAHAGAGRDYRGRVKRIAPIVDPRSGTVKVTVDVGGQPGLLPGMYVDVDLVTATHADAVLVPKRALIYDSDQIFVYRLGEERRVERIFIEPRLADKHNVEPIEGIAAGDEIIVAGQAGLLDGALVKLPGDEPEEETDGSEDAESTAEIERASR